MLKLNLPTPEGISLGKEIVRLIGTPDDCCHDCATRLGSGPSGCPETLLDFIECSRTGEPFLCHMTGKACAGWVRSQRLTGATNA